ncbi:aminoacyl-tRNA hydrolase [Brevibacillus sp. NPDC058079]|uniref:aminoacyl-tRNA hydrolase n=1 Tax=Brevibacillus sp. NPDC058079 TaxID=3346330 RepID=UPI0036ECAA6D
MNIHELDWLVNHLELLTKEDLETLKDVGLIELRESESLYSTTIDVVALATLLTEMYQKYQSETDLVQYFIVNKDLKMSPGKIGAQIAHVQAKIIDCCSKRDASGEESVRYYQDWFESKDRKIIVLSGKEKALLKLMDQGWFYNRDNGLTEVPADSLTCIGYYPMPKYQMKKLTNRFQLL